MLLENLENQVSFSYTWIDHFINMQRKRIGVQ